MSDIPRLRACAGRTLLPVLQFMPLLDHLDNIPYAVNVNDFVLLGIFLEP